MISYYSGISKNSPSEEPAARVTSSRFLPTACISLYYFCFVLFILMDLFTDGRRRGVKEREGREALCHLARHPFLAPL